jgi:hypothetical protein
MAGLALFLLVFTGSAAAWSHQAYAQEKEESSEHVEFAANIEFIKGHLAQAVANKQAGENELAIAHAGHPVEEVYSLIEEELAEHNAELNTQLKESLTNLANQIQTMQAQAVQTQVAQINTMLDQAKSSVIGQGERNDPEFNALVIISLLETAEHEYEEAVSGGEIVEMVEYQDSTAFIARAEAIFDTIKAQVPEHEGEEIAEFFEDLNSLTAANASFEEVETVIGGIAHEFEEVYGLESEKQVDGQKIIDNINKLLDESLAAYDAGNMQRAKALAVEAYLENYELIEGDIEEDDPELMEKIEVDLREELVQMIDAQTPASEIEAHVNSIKSDLETARAIVVPEFPAVILAIAAVMAAVITIGRFKGASLFNRRASL